MRKLLKSLTGVVLILMIIGVCASYWFSQRYNGKPLAFSTLPLRIKIEKGQGIRSLANTLATNGVKISAVELEVAARARGDQAKIKSGVYEFKTAVNIEQLLDKVISGETLQFEVRLVEGWTFKQYRESLAKSADLKQDTVALSDAQIMKAIGAPESKPEGLFFPDTYMFPLGSSDLDVYKRAYKEQQNRLTKIWASRPADSPLKTPYEALTLASIVEKETGREEDRDKVAAVFLNRLKIGMMLQSDPTTIYGLGGDFDGNLRRKDLKADTPFNTYTRNGLTPTPISMPGANSLKAIMNPANIAALYFVARGDGTSEFSDDLGAHNRAVNKFQRGGGVAKSATKSAAQ